MRLVVVLVVLAALAGPAASAAGPDRRTDVVEALGVLHDWDTRRARAWANSDEKGLRSLYLPGSAAARADVRLLRSYTARGLVVRRLVTQVFGVRVLRRERGRVVIRVLDRFAGGQVTDGDRTRALPSSRPVLRRIELRRAAGHWKVASVGR
jgi:hypothetical protein